MEREMTWNLGGQRTWNHMLVSPGGPQRNRELKMKENSISSSLLPVALD